MSKISYSVIGGADGPTSIFVAGQVGNGFEILFQIASLLIIAVIMVIIVKCVGQWNKNNHSPRLEVEAKIVSKREEVSRHRHANAGDVTGVHGYHTSVHTSYYVTFQVASGDRMEFSVSGSEYGILGEGDYGRVSFQGTRYLGFKRESL